ncbi:collagenase [Aliiglaciecola sp. 3_MG-2023]|uniref:collagenase n=1 Tax=Aliiglaciecola sp. 3_MG-2023 TaxID=3062644 RepID=UPI0026E4496F|nr:collagenase [Aliiglaciecola sp. 3_MG-2023]MDO6693561.1 collagenase [Aliiglaciecola sp. 3_MG-2023]
MLVSKSRTFKLTIVLLIILVNSLAVLYLGRERLALPEWLVKPLSYIELLINEEDEITSVPLTPLDNVQPQHNIDLPASGQQPDSAKLIANINNHGELSTTGSLCSDSRPNLKSKQIYTWIDNDGNRHISDKSRSVNSDTSVSVIATIQPEALSINYSGTVPPYRLQQEIHSRVMTNKDLFAQITAKDLVRPITINFRFFKDINSYNKYQKQVAPTIESAIGFYVSHINESVVMINDDKQSVDTAVHEAMHAINRHWFGHMSKWLNEGIAEYAESSQSTSPSNSQWRAHIQKHGTLPLTTLFKANGSLWEADKTMMYATSWAFIAYLMENHQQTLARLLLEENNNGCNVVNISDIERISSYRLSMLQNNFTHWLKHI